MNARIPNLRIVSPHQHSLIVAPYGFNLTCSYELDEGEAPAPYGANPSPGTPPSAQLLACFVGSVNIMDMLSSG